MDHFFPYGLITDVLQGSPDLSQCFFPVFVNGFFSVVQGVLPLPLLSGSGKKSFCVFLPSQLHTYSTHTSFCSRHNRS